MVFLWLNQLPKVEHHQRVFYLTRLKALPGKSNFRLSLFQNISLLGQLKAYTLQTELDGSKVNPEISKQLGQCAICLNCLSIVIRTRKITCSYDCGLSNWLNNGKYESGAYISIDIQTISTLKFPCKVISNHLAQTCELFFEKRS